MAPSLRRRFVALGTTVEIGVLGSGADMETAIDAGRRAISAIMLEMNFHDSGSGLSRLNMYPGQRVPVSRDLVRVLRLARALGIASGERFNCTVGGGLVAAGVLPALDRRVSLEVGVSEDIEIGRDWARLRRPVRITLNGIAKGYAVDLAVAALRRAGATAGWVDAGGDLRAFGKLSLPVARRDAAGRAEPLGYLQDAALATSAARNGGSHDGALHLLTADGPVPAGETFSVMARSAWRADALTKVAASANASQAASLIAGLGGVLLKAVSVESIA